MVNSEELNKNKDKQKLETGVDSKKSTADDSVNAQIATRGVEVDKKNVKKLSFRERGHVDIADYLSNFKETEKSYESIKSSAEELYQKQDKAYSEYLENLLKEKPDELVLKDKELRALFSEYFDPSIGIDRSYELRSDIINKLTLHGVKLNTIDLIESKKQKYATVFYNSKITFNISLKALRHTKDDEERKKIPIVCKRAAELNRAYIEGKINQKEYHRSYVSNLKDNYGDIEDEEFQNNFTSLEDSLKYMINDVNDATDAPEEITKKNEPEEFKAGKDEIENFLQDSNLTVSTNKSGYAEVKAEEELFELSISKAPNGDFNYYIQDEYASKNPVGPLLGDELALKINERYIDRYLSKEIMKINTSNNDESPADITDEKLIKVAKSVLNIEDSNKFNFNDVKKYLKSLAILISNDDPEYKSMKERVEVLSDFLDSDTKKSFLSGVLANEDANTGINEINVSEIKKRFKTPYTSDEDDKAA